MAKHVPISILKIDDISGETFGRTLAPASVTDIHTLWTAHQYLDSVSSLWQGLAAYWKLEEASGTRADSFYNHPMSEIGGTIANAAGKVGSAANFVRTDNRRLQAAQDDPVIGTGDVDFTFSCWVNLTSKTVSAPSSDFQAIIIKHNVSDESTEYKLIYNGTLDRFQFLVTGATATADNLGSPSTGTWYFILVEHNASANTISIEVNRGTPNTASGAAPVRRTGPLIFGADIFGGGSLLRAYDGLLDEVGFWRRLLTSTEKDELYNSGTGITIPATVYKENRVVRYAKSVDTGAIWTDGAGGGSGSSFDVSNTAQAAIRPASALDSTGWLHIVWEDKTSGQLYYRSRTAAGVWSSIDTASLVAAGKTITRPHIITTPNDSLHVVAWNTTDNAVYWAYSTDNGTTWTVSSSQFTGGTANYWQMGFDADSLNNLHLAFIKSTNKAAYAKATFSGPSTWVWGAEDTTSINDGSVSNQGDCTLVVSATDDDVFVSWEAIFSSPNGVRLRWSKRPGGTGSFSTIANVAFTSTTTNAYRKPVIGQDSDGAICLAHAMFTSSGETQNSKLTFEDDDTGIEVFTNAELAITTADVFGEETVTRTLSPHVPKKSFGSVIPATFVDPTNSHLRFTTFHPIVGIVRKNPASDTLNVSTSVQEVLVRFDATTFHSLHTAVSPTRFRYMKSTDEGVTWTDGEGGASNSFFTLKGTTLTFIDAPAIAVDSLGNIYTAWTERSSFSGASTVFFRRRVSGVWQAEDSVSLTVAGKQIRNPSLLVDKNGNIHVIAFNRTDFFFYHAYSLDQGATWTVFHQAIAYGNLASESNPISYDRDNNNNLLLVVSQFDTVNSRTVPGIYKAIFTSPSTWTWQAIDETTFANTDVAFEMREVPHLRSEYASSSGRFDVLWREDGGSGGSAPSVVRHGFKTNTSSSIATISTTTNDTAVLVQKLVRDDSVHLYALLRYPDDSGGMVFTVAVFNKTTQTWSNISPLARNINVAGSGNGMMLESRPIHPTPSTGSIYVISSGGNSSLDDRRTIWIEAAASLPTAPPPPVETTQTILSETEIVREFLIKDVLAQI